MSVAAEPLVQDYLNQLPFTAVVYYRQLLQKFPFLPTFAIARSAASHALTVVLLAVSLFGFYQLGSLAMDVMHVDASASKSQLAASNSQGAAAQKPAAAAVHALPRSAPTQLSIPAINIDSPVVGVGQDSNGAIEVPGPEETGWYNLGPSPGEIGPAVIVGHVDYVNVGPAVFWNLRNMKKGDEISINREDGSTVKFKVTEVDTYQQDAFPTDKVYGNINYPGLRLVTCDGDFNYVTHHYSDDLVVYAKAEL